MVKSKLFYGILVLVVVIVTIFIWNSSSQSSGDVVGSELAGEWIDFELRDVKTGQTFKVSDFDRPVLLESFAVWCPTCTRQQREIRELHDEVGDSIISISLDTDPNEDEERVRQHIESNGFDWYYAIAPVEFTQSLIDQFGVSIVNAPSAPVVLICDDQKVRKLGSGVKSASQLKQEVERGC